MRLKWENSNRKIDNGTIFHARYGLIHAEIEQLDSGDETYCIYTISSGTRRTLVRVTYNPPGPNQVNAKERARFLMTCLENHFDFEPLECEKTQSAKLDLRRRPKIPKPVLIQGVLVNRTYQHIATGALYRVFSVMNANSEKWVPYVGYRNIFSGEDYGRPAAEFTGSKYRLAPPYSVIKNPHDFQYATTRKLANALDSLILQPVIEKGNNDENEV